MFRVEKGHDRHSDSIDDTPQYFGRIMQDASNLRISATHLAKLEVRAVLAVLVKSPQGLVMYEIQKTQQLNDS